MLSLNLQSYLEISANAELRLFRYPLEMKSFWGWSLVEQQQSADVIFLKHKQYLQYRILKTDPQVTHWAKCCILKSNKKQINPFAVLAIQISFSPIFLAGLGVFGSGGRFSEHRIFRTFIHRCLYGWFRPYKQLEVK